jgi:hypothetical protein
MDAYRTNAERRAKRWEGRIGRDAGASPVGLHGAATRGWELVGFYDIFNGDADGLCALQQLRLAEPRTATLVTGTKRDIALLDRVQSQSGDDLTVLDVSLRANKDGLCRALAAGARVRWFDHHDAGEVPASANLEAHLDFSPAICTSLIVDRHVCGRFRAWAVAGAFGDNLVDSARAVAATLDLGPSAIDALKRVGECLNYNAYGERVEELAFHPEVLYRRLAPYESPLDFAARDEAIPALDRARSEDLARALAIGAALDTPYSAAVVLPDASWSRRVSGTLANHLATTSPSRATAVLTPSGGAYTVSLRAPREHPHGAERLAQAFGGGGRAAAAGINGLPASDVVRFLEAFRRAFTST